MSFFSMLAKRPGLTSGTMGLGVGAGYGAYRSNPGQRLQGAAIGAGIGLAGGLTATKGAMFLNNRYELTNKASRLWNSTSQMRGRVGSRIRGMNTPFGPYQYYGPVRQSNKGVNSWKDALFNVGFLGW